ncbi:MAG: alginate export family protein [Flavobacteriales bacterium]|nr:MAG: hypothetical protein F9K28_09640 [Bacteroidota bacterium]KXK34923.1 MAG: hypothetical protein UZ06_CHB003000831 [Chlorobi bacterium OLB6]MBE2264845.1 alginate export family protein [Flavobacteriales bacterium]MBV6462892.1 hypothetical protein [Chlorobiota bacterium]MBW7853492.1 alginate export family protein [Candidatus Kapabacteria bacterium]MCC6331585.1 alginate export family protein [Ignavibacteria bacterium]
MKIRLFARLLITIMALISTGTMAVSEDVVPENRFRAQVQLRPRAEYRDGAFRPLAEGESPAALITQRSRLVLTYHYKDLLTLQLSPQNVTLWGQDPLTQGAGGGNSVSFFEAWAELNLGSLWELRIGRQQIVLDDERFYGSSDWSQGGRSHDAISLSYQGTKFQAKAFAAYNQNYNTLYSGNLNNPSGSLFTPAGAAPYKSMATLWAQYKPNTRHTMSALVANLGFQNASGESVTEPTYINSTVGLNYSYKDSTWDSYLSGYYQLGDNERGLSTKAYLIAARTTLALDKTWSIGAGVDVLSGNDVGTAPVMVSNFAFTPYLGTGHKFYGSMDYFYAGSPHQGAGLADIYFRAVCTPSEVLTISAGLHQFNTTGIIVSNADRLSADLGQEADFDITYKVNRFTRITGGYSMYFTTPTIQYLKNVTGASDTQPWVWFGVLINPTILNVTD